jgi:hypothetical protein
MRFCGPTCARIAYSSSSSVQLLQPAVVALLPREITTLRADMEEAEIQGQKGVYSRHPAPGSSS